MFEDHPLKQNVHLPRVFFEPNASRFFFEPICLAFFRTDCFHWIYKICFWWSSKLLLRIKATTSWSNFPAKALVNISMLQEYVQIGLLMNW